MSVTIALPTGRSMEAQTIALLEESGLTIDRTYQRSIMGSISGLKGLDRVIFCRPSEIPRLVIEGKAQIGITGRDILVEKGLQNKVETLSAKIEFSRSSRVSTKCVIFAKESDPVESLDELLEKARGSVIATEYLTETRKFLDGSLGKPADFIYQEWSGSAEVAVVTGMARFGVVVVETGSTLGANDLKVLKGSVIGESTPIVIANKEWIAKDFGREVKKICDPLSLLLTGVTMARKSVLLVMNVPKDSLVETLAMMPSMESPTIQPLVDESFVSCSSVVPRNQVNNIIAQALQLGCKDFLKLNASGMM